MLINPFEVRPYSIETEPEKPAEDFAGEIVDELVLKKSELITAVQEGRASKTTLIQEIKSIIRDKKIWVKDIASFAEKVGDILFGYGILQPYIDNPDISDILVNSQNIVFIKKFGKKLRAPVNFGTEENLLLYCHKLAAICGGKLDENANAETVLTDRKRNMRIVISLKPINVLSPSICIRKPTTGYELTELVEKGMITEKQKTFFETAVKQQKTIVIAGKGGSGKTTLMGALIEEMPREERGLLIQETFEIQPRHSDVVCKLVKLSDNLEVKDYTLFELTKIGLLMSLDRIFIGEIKDREAFDFFNAVYTGHNGSMATVHANNAGEVINRLVQLMKRSGTDIPFDDLKQMLHSSLDLIVFMKDYKVVEIQKVGK
ncbi:ATPase, T2SS/T4P/T4SS family [Tepidanaerobacter acetatoxydans]|uniref:ATPase, T2SS/T4P/T4SS family n=1 Tax=Tepidanaerobacter acetatoxydans TaxID=499229 RepID=UPI001BD695ED|nr:ATPase, T2SS/T4P/T4SS family [Tepidanaerobacter acetatoxydans]